MQPAVHDATFVYPPGSLTVMTGPSGIGKSTLMRLLRFHRADQGSILLDGKNLEEYTTESSQECCSVLL